MCRINGLALIVPGNEKRSSFHSWRERILRPLGPPVLVQNVIEICRCFKVSSSGLPGEERELKRVEVALVGEGPKQLDFDR